MDLGKILNNNKKDSIKVFGIEFKKLNTEANMFYMFEHKSGNQIFLYKVYKDDVWVCYGKTFSGFGPSPKMAVADYIIRKISKKDII